MSPLFSRHILACLHFNENLRRETKCIQGWETLHACHLSKIQVGRGGRPGSCMRSKLLHLTKNLLNYNRLLVLHAKTSDLHCGVLCYSHLLDKVGTAFL